MTAPPAPSAPTLHHCLSARSFRPLWTLEEIGLPYELKVWPFPPRVHAKAFLAINPLGTVPVLVDGDTLMTESAAICQYLAARHSPGQIDVAPAEAEYGAYLNFLHQGEATLTFPQTLVLRYARFEPPERRQPQVADDYAKWFIARTRMLAQRMATREFVCAGRFTAADVSVGYALMLGETLGLQAGYAPTLHDYWERLKQRPAYQRALAAQQAAAVAQGIATAPAGDS
jgi:glutathione S-transferase